MYTNRKEYYRSLVVTFAMVFLMSCKLRDVLMTKPYELTFREMGDPGPREAKLYHLEHILYGKLIYILRSSEALISYSQYKMKNII
ncbi:unnamed protein product [Gongylonema pulchrum]|uniref:Lipoprotein n=1 Tax=Gongylonema pulchrum TaxID=637853 RepID=A0A183D143_9BILA|nr:unnamed protein product [Gongylonema pulchrum]